MKKRNRSLTIVGALLLILAIFLAIQEKEPEIKHQSQPQISSVQQSKLGLVPVRSKKIEHKQKEQGFKIVTSVSMYDPSSSVTTKAFEN